MAALKVKSNKELWEDKENTACSTGSLKNILLHDCGWINPWNTVCALEMSFWRRAAGISRLERKHPNGQIGQIMGVQSLR